MSTTIAADDSYLAGYAHVVRRHEFNAVGASLEVQGGVVMVDAESLGPVDRTIVMTALERIPSVVQVEFREGQTHTDVREPLPIQQDSTKLGSQFLLRHLINRAILARQA